MTSPEGLLFVDKPVWLSSHDVVNVIRRVTAIRRVGHTGTLDPLATGLLILCIGRATRLAEYISGQDKHYQATIRLGQETSTYDREGQIVNERPVKVTLPDLEEVLDHFRGQIEQKPPIFSAVKIGGQPLYRLARRGQVAEQPSRQVMIHTLTLSHWNPPELQISVKCSSGTYIRSIAHDLGQLLGCGGHLTNLRRTAIGKLTIDQAQPLDEIRADNWQPYLQPMDLAISHLPAIYLSSEEAQIIAQGQRLPAADPAVESHTEPASDPKVIRAYTEDRKFVGILLCAGNTWQPKKIFYQPDP